MHLRAFLPLLAALALGQPAPRNAGRGLAPPPPPLGVIPKPAIPNVKPVRSCESLAMVALPDTTVESAALDPDDPGICRVTAITTHPPAGDKVRIWVGIPMANWNGRFLGIGGGGFAGGSAAGIRQPVALGYASGSTDTGHEGGSGSFALDANGRLNWQLIRDNAHVGIHEMTVTGKALSLEHRRRLDLASLRLEKCVVLGLRHAALSRAGRAPRNGTSPGGARSRPGGRDAVEARTGRVHLPASYPNDLGGCLQCAGRNWRARNACFFTALDQFRAGVAALDDTPRDA